MVNERMVVSVLRDGDLLVRVDPRRTEEQLAFWVGVALAYNGRAGEGKRQ